MNTAYIEPIKMAVGAVAIIAGLAWWFGQDHLAGQPMTGQEYGRRSTEIIDRYARKEQECRDNNPGYGKSTSPAYYAMSDCINKVWAAKNKELEALQAQLERGHPPTAQHTPQVPDSFYGNTPNIYPCPPSSPHAPQTFSYYGCR